MKLLIRVDASAEIGAGHLMRCLALAQAWQARGGEATFLTASPPAGVERVAREGFELLRCSHPSGSEADARETLELARRLGASWVVVDGYVFDADYQRRLKQAGLRLLWIDDDGRAAPYCADLILNQNLHAHADLYRRRELATELLLGSSYVLLRRELLLWQGWRREVADVGRRLLVSAGGADPGGLTCKIVQALVRAEAADREVIVVVGALAAHDAGLAALLAERRGFELRRDVADMPALMAWADLAVSAAGGTVWELAFMALPALLVSVVPNQGRLAAEMHARGAAVDLGPADVLAGERLAAEIARLLERRGEREALARRSREIVDGGGSARVADRLAR